MMEIVTSPTYIDSTANVCHVFQMNAPNPVRAPSCSPTTINNNAMPHARRNPAKISGSAPGSAIVKKTLRELAPKFFPTSK